MERAVYLITALKSFEANDNQWPRSRVLIYTLEIAYVGSVLDPSNQRSILCCPTVSLQYSRHM
jgi:hypothetical protein